MQPTASAISSAPSIDAQTLLTLSRTHAETYMSQPHYDASHDWTHVQRVVALAKCILSVESQSPCSPVYDPLLIELAALLHDVGDHKYAAPRGDPTTEVHRLLTELGADGSFAVTVQEVVNCVSYAHEIKNPDKVRGVLSKHPELGIVQDADRLDAIGAVGIGRLFTYGGAKKRELSSSMGHADVKLVKLEGLMKTAEGKRLARERTKRIEIFQEWWAEEVAGIEDQKANAQ
ncbi:MAG: hypothetical protein MMC23_003044 [Stictis urceolatum]|nr:hypothetical protein [Stictis urceolata]